MSKSLKITIIVLAVVLVVAVGWLVMDYFLYEPWDDDYFDESDAFYDPIDDETGDDESYTQPVEIENNTKSDPSKSAARDQLMMLTVLINFNDEEISTTPDQWSEFFFGAHKSVAHYYHDMSKGRLAILPAEETQGIVNDGIIEVDIDLNHPNLHSNSTDSDYDVCTDIFQAVLNKVDQYINFSQYDFDGDGNVLARELSINLIAAGYEDGEFIDGQNTVAGICINEEYFFEVDQKGLGDYILYGEMDMAENGRGDIVTIGVACHELGHVLGLPDLYDTDYSSIGLGFHALMSEGNNNRLTGDRLGTTPAPLIAWSKDLLGFVQTQIIDKSGEYTLYGQSTNDYNVLRIDDGSGYYLIENIDFNGYGAGLREYMDHGGIAIWYIDPHAASADAIAENVVNDNDIRRGVQLIEAQGRDDLMEESLDYDNPDYDHYFADGYIAVYQTNSGITITVLDGPGKVMRVKINMG